jgi:DNA-binding MurR/RpiR family transcriptional regulator
MFEQIHRIGSKDLIIGISFPRYSKRTLKAMDYAKSKGAGVLTITDSPLSPMVQFSSCSLIARSDMVSFVDSLVAPLSLVNAIIVALSIRKKESLVNSLESLEKIWTEYQVYDNEDDINIDNNLGADYNE